MHIELLGAVIEAVTGGSLGDFLKATIFEPLGMDSTSFALDEGQQARLAPLYAYVKDDDTLVESQKWPGHIDVHRGGPLDKVPSGGAGLFSTEEDFVKFGICLAKGTVLPDGSRLLRPATFDEMRVDQLAKMGAVVPAEPRFPFGDAATGEVAMFGGSWGLVGACIDPSTPPHAMTARLPGPYPGSPGSFGWSGAAGTLFHADPRNELCVCLSMQAFLYFDRTFRAECVRMAYALFSDLHV